MRCLYCGGGVPWRPLKWLIDDDFCSKSHRNSYHERFRKAISNLADLQIHPNDPLKRAEFLLQLPQLLSNSTGIDPMLIGPSFAPSEMFLCSVGVAPLVVLAEALPVLDLIQPAGPAYPSRYRDVAPSLVFQTHAFKLSAPVNGTFAEHRLNAIGFQDLARSRSSASYRLLWLNARSCCRSWLSRSGAIFQNSSLLRSNPRWPAINPSLPKYYSQVSIRRHRLTAGSCESPFLAMRTFGARRIQPAHRALRWPSCQRKASIQSSKTGHSEFITQTELEHAGPCERF